MKAIVPSIALVALFIAAVVFWWNPINAAADALAVEVLKPVKLLKP